MNHTEMSESCWDNTFSTDVSDKWNISAERHGGLFIVLPAVN